MNMIKSLLGIVMGVLCCLLILQAEERSAKRDVPPQRLKISQAVTNASTMRASDGDNKAPNDVGTSSADNQAKEESGLKDTSKKPGSGSKDIETGLGFAGLVTTLSPINEPIKWFGLGVMVKSLIKNAENAFKEKLEREKIAALNQEYNDQTMKIMMKRSISAHDIAALGKLQRDLEQKKLAAKVEAQSLASAYGKFYEELIKHVLFSVNKDQVAKNIISEHDASAIKSAYGAGLKILLLTTGVGSPVLVMGASLAYDIFSTLYSVNQELSKRSEELRKKDPVAYHLNLARIRLIQTHSTASYCGPQNPHCLFDEQFSQEELVKTFSNIMLSVFGASVGYFSHYIASNIIGLLGSSLTMIAQKGAQEWLTKIIQSTQPYLSKGGSLEPLVKAIQRYVEFYVPATVNLELQQLFEYVDMALTDAQKKLLTDYVKTSAQAHGLYAGFDDVTKFNNYLQGQLA